MDRREPQTVRLEGFDAHGTTRARTPGRWIEVEHGIPGEEVRVEISGSRRLHGRIIEILDASPDRVEPECVYFRDWACGGCQWQHLSYASQLRRKQEATESELRAAGLDLAVSEVHAGNSWRYRSTAGISLGKHAGFHRRASLAIVPIQDCPISHPLIGSLMGELNMQIAGGSLPDFRGRVQIDARVVGAPNAPNLQVLVRPDGERRPPEASLETLVGCLAEVKAIQSILMIDVDGSVRTVRGELFQAAEIAGREVNLTAAAFSQTNLPLLETLIDRLREASAPLAGKRVADVYGGTGVLGLFLAAEARAVTVIESDEIALRAGILTAQQWGLRNVEFVCGRAEDVFQRADFDVVIVDPPRAGLSAAVCETIARDRPPLVLYISCLPQSLARDLVALTAHGYGVDTLELFDFYPQTYHTELLAVLRLK
ncbi:MAG: 23S rRNA (uracil(1939)-C(5))-methyltransferase RlmD [Chloroflexota bacterium]